MRRAFFRIVTLLLVVTVGLALAEIALRLFRPQVTAFTGLGMFAPDPDLGHIVKPGSDTLNIGANSFGFRDKEYSLKKPPDAYRIVVIGDSFTFGAVPSKDVYTEILEQLFEEAGLPFAVEVINTGVPGYNTEQELGHLKKFGIRFKPDLVIVGFFIGGDIPENRKTQFFDVVDGELVRPHARPEGFQRWLNRFHLYRLLRGAFTSEVHAAPPEAESSERESFLACEGARLQVCMIRPPDAIVEAYRMTKELLLELRDYVRDQGVDLVVLLMPDEVQVNPSVFRDVLEKFSFNAADFDLDLPNRRLLALLEREGVCAVDILEECRSRNLQEPVYIPRNTHWTRAGNEIAAKAIYQCLLSRCPRLRAARH